MKMHESLTTDLLCEAVKSEMFGLENPGFCITCGLEHDSCEPDARNYSCEECGTPTVFGAAELLLYL